MRIGIKFCGHCSPRTDMSSVEAKLRETGEPHEFVYITQNTQADALLVLNACESACAGIPSFDGRIIVATPETVDRIPVNSEELAEIILEKINSE